MDVRSACVVCLLVGRIAYLLQILPHPPVVSLLPPVLPPRTFAWTVSSERNIRIRILIRIRITVISSHYFCVAFLYLHSSHVLSHYVACAYVMCLIKNLLTYLLGF